MNINNKIDHTILSSNATDDMLIKYCEDAVKYGFASVVVNSGNIPLIAKHLRHSVVNPVAVVGFPLGAVRTNVKAFEAQEAVRLGAKEIDMVINIGNLKDRDFSRVFEDIDAVVKASSPALVKVIIETSELTDQEKINACELSIKAGAHFVKTSTGFTSSGASVKDIELIKSVVGNQIKVKASGGIRTLEDAMALIDAGADRLGVGDGKLLV